jgi:alpha-galactosidase
MLNPFLTLHGQTTTLILECRPDEAPLWRYWGPRLPDGVTPGVDLRATRPEPSFSLGFDQPLSVYPGVGQGWFGQSAVLAHRAGRDWSTQITQCEIERPDEATARLIMTDNVSRVESVMTFNLNPATDVLTLSSRLANIGDDILDVAWLAAGGVPLPPDAETVHSFAGRHNQEFVPVDDTLTRSLWRRENRKGLTSHDCFPGAIAICGDGTAYGAQLAWSGNHVQQIEWIDDGRWHWQMGEWLAPGEVRLAPGESIETPDMLATCSTEGRNGVAWNFHRAIRQRMTWPGGKMNLRPVHLNTWEAMYFDHKPDELMELATAAATVGVERFVLDDGWFVGRNDDTSALGDWWPDPAKYPDGLSPLAQHVTGLGMEFGLWVEPEMINPDSELFRAHPDWALQQAGRPMITGRNQLVLDLTQPEVGDYLFGKIAALLETLPIGYLKWDHNRDLAQAGATPLYRRQVQAAYALFARFRAAFPDVEIEACAGGGGRIDAGIARYTHRFWASDCIDAVSRAQIQRGFLQFMPAELMGSHVGASPAHSTGRMQSMAFRCGVATPGHFGVELDVRKISEDERTELASAIARYKNLRGRLHGVRTWFGNGPDGLIWQAHGDADAFVLFVTRTGFTTQRQSPTLRLPMLLDVKYSISSDFSPDMIAEGAWLRQAGLPLPPGKAEGVLIWEIRKV